MTETGLDKFKTILEDKQVELERVVRNRDGIVIEKSADALDEVQHAVRARAGNTQSRSRLDTVEKGPVGPSSC